MRSLMPWIGAVRRHAAVIEAISAALIVTALLIAGRTLPLDRAITALQDWVEGYGAWGPIVFSAFFVLAALLLMPGSALTIAAGAVFGLWLGTLTVSFASTAAAAIAFLIARHFARDVVAARARRFRRFRAIDEAIAEGGVRIVALLRLSPAMPYSLVNYLLGLTGIAWLPYVVVSWLFMLPWTLVYVYLGDAGARGLAAAAAEGPEGSRVEWIAFAVGLVATVVMTVYITKLARKKIAEQTDIEEAPAPHGPGAQAHERWPWRATVIAAIAILAMLAALWARANPDRVADLLGPSRTP